MARSIAAGITVVLSIWVYYLALPAWNIRSAGLWSYCLCVAVIAIVAFGLAEDKTAKKNADYVGSIASIVCAAAILIGMLVCGISSSYVTNAKDYHNMIEFVEGNFDEDIPKLSEDMPISIVDVDTAKKLGDRTIGGIKNATWYDVGNEYNLIKYQDEYYRIAELNYGSLFKYDKAKDEGIPGYVMVNAETQEAKYVELANKIKYSPSGYFSNLLRRHLRKQYPSYMFDKSFFEIDEDGLGHYITGVFKPTIGVFGGKKIESFIVTDVTSGESKEYKTENLPKWIDHAYSLSYLMRITKNHQTYIGGFLNSWFAKTGIDTTTYKFKDDGFDGYNTAIDENGEVVFFTGVTSVNNAESNKGFILANPRTGEIKYYICSGAEESSAQNAAQGLVEDFGYVATFPTILNIEGEETYFMLLKDSAGLVQRYALANIKNYSIVVQGKTFNETLKLYKERIVGEEVFTKEGKIQKMYQAEVDGCTYYYFIIEGDTGLYMSSIKNSNKQVTLKNGDEILIEYKSSSEEGVYSITKITF